MKRRPVFEADYNDWTREQLLQRIHSLEGSINPSPRRKKPERPFDFSLYPTQHIALKIAYFGWDYNGFASQMSYRSQVSGEMEKDPQAKSSNEGSKFEEVKLSVAFPSNPTVVTVEDVLFQAFLKTRLIESPKSCNYSRCGRTDTGVSSVGQVIALTVRSSAKKLTDPTRATTFDIPICTMLNRNLPPDIRVLGWSKVSPKFDARFSCRGRRYKYFFSGIGLDISKMRLAAKKLIGEHDFFNFCRKDKTKMIECYIRRIFSSEIHDYGDGMFDYEVHGSAFLYHQVRCIMEILFLIGRGLEPPEVIDYLLNVQAAAAAPPQYDLASEIPLVLVECYYDECEGLDFNLEKSEQARIESEFFHISRDLQAKAMIVNLLRGDETSASAPFLGKGNFGRIYNSK